MPIQFQVSAHLQSYEILRLMKNMMEDYKNRLNEQVAAAQESNEVISSRPLPILPSVAESAEEQILQDEELANILAAEEKRKADEVAEQEAKKKEQEAVNEKLQQILRMLENGPESGTSSKTRSRSRSGSEREQSSSDEESIVKMMMKDAAEKRADRQSRRKDIDAVLSGKLGGLNLGGPGSPHNPYSGIPGRRGPTRVTNRNSGNVNTTTVYGSHNDNSTVTQITKGKSCPSPILSTL